MCCYIAGINQPIHILTEYMQLAIDSFFILNKITGGKCKHKTMIYLKKWNAFKMYIGLFITLIGPLYRVRLH